MFHEKYDRDLTREEFNDFEHHLNMKRRMTQSLYLMRERKRSLTAESSQVSQQQENEDNANCSNSMSMEEKKPRRKLIKEKHVDIEDTDICSDEKDSRYLNFEDHQV